MYEAHSYNNREFYHQHRSLQIVVEEYIYGSRQEIGSLYCQIVYADFNRKSYFPIGFHGGSRIEPSRAERSNRTVQSVWADAIKSTDAVELSKPKRDMRGNVYIYICIVYMRSSKKHEENQLFEASKRGRRSAYRSIFTSTLLLLRA